MTRDIKTINLETGKGKMLIYAIAKAMCRLYPNKTPNRIYSTHTQTWLLHYAIKCGYFD
jgi:hypothetical protein